MFDCLENYIVKNMRGQWKRRGNEEINVHHYEIMLCGKRTPF